MNTRFRIAKKTRDSLRKQIQPACFHFPGQWKTHTHISDHFNMGKRHWSASIFSFRPSGSNTPSMAIPHAKGNPVLVRSQGSPIHSRGSPVLSRSRGSPVLSRSRESPTMLWSRESPTLLGRHQQQQQQLHRHKLTLPGSSPGSTPAEHEVEGEVSRLSDQVRGSPLQGSKVLPEGVHPFQWS